MEPKIDISNENRLEVEKQREWISKNSNLTVEQKQNLRPCGVNYLNRKPDNLIAKLAADGITHFYYCPKCNPSGIEDHYLNAWECDICKTPVTQEFCGECTICHKNVCESCSFYTNNKDEVLVCINHV